MRKPAAAEYPPVNPASDRPAQRSVPDEAWRVFLPEDEPVDPLPESGDFDWEEDWNDWSDAA